MSTQLLQKSGRFDFDHEDGLPPDEPRFGILRLNRRVVKDPKKRRRGNKPDPDEMLPGEICIRCEETEAGVKGYSAGAGWYRLHWSCTCGRSWTETKKG